MAFEISVNIEYMFQEAGDRLEDRIAAAAAAGYRKVEMFTTDGRDVASLASALADNVLGWEAAAENGQQVSLRRL